MAAAPKFSFKIYDLICHSSCPRNLLPPDPIRLPAYKTHVQGYNYHFRFFLKPQPTRDYPTYVLQVPGH